jgi:hypothetical protein
MNEQAQNLKRVKGNIDAHVLAFCRERFDQCPPRFFMTELTTFVRNRIGIAPDSPGRILRSLRQDGSIDYDVINRRASLYELTAVKPPVP